MRGAYARETSGAKQVKDWDFTHGLVLNGLAMAKRRAGAHDNRNETPGARDRRRQECICGQRQGHSKGPKGLAFTPCSRVRYGNPRGKGHGGAVSGMAGFDARGGTKGSTLATQMVCARARVHGHVGV
jgi:hypothetical protein